MIKLTDTATGKSYKVVDVRVPKEGEQIKHENLTFTIKKSDERKISKVEIRKS